MMKVDEITSRKIELMALLCSVLVVAIHVPSAKEAAMPAALAVKRFFTEGVCRIAVPFFFVASGFLLALRVNEPNWYFQALRKRVKSLLVPYVLWSVLWYSYSTVLSGLSNYMAGKPAGWTLSQVPWETILGLNLSAYPSFFPLWFIRALVVFVVVAPVIVFMMRRRVAAWICLILLFASVICVATLHDNTVVCFSVEGLFYFAVGIFISLQRPSVRQNKSVAVLFITLSMAIFLIESVNLYRSACLHQLGIMLGLAGSISVVPDVRLPPFLRGKAFPIYLLHLFAIIPTAMVVHLLTGDYAFNVSLSGYFFYWVSGVVLSIAAANAMSLLLPRLSGILWGGRR